MALNSSQSAGLYGGGIVAFSLLSSYQPHPSGKEFLDLSWFHRVGFGVEGGWQVERVDRSAILSQSKMTESGVVAQ